MLIRARIILVGVMAMMMMMMVIQGRRENAAELPCLRLDAPQADYPSAAGDVSPSKVWRSAAPSNERLPIAIVDGATVQTRSG